MDTLAVMLNSKGLKAKNEGIAIAVSRSSSDEVQRCLGLLLSEGAPDTYKLAQSVLNKQTEKYDGFLTDELLSADYAAAKFDGVRAFDAVETLTTWGSSYEGARLNFTQNEANCPELLNLPNQYKPSRYEPA